MSQLVYEEMIHNNYKNDNSIPKSSSLHQPATQSQNPAFFTYNTSIPFQYEDRGPQRLQTSQQYFASHVAQQQSFNQSPTDNTRISTQQQLLMDIEQFKSENKILASKNSSLENQLQSQSKELALYRNQAQRENELIGQIEELKNNIIILKSDNRKMQAQIQEDQYALKDFENIKRQASQVQALNSQLDSAQQQIERLKVITQDQKRQIDFLKDVELENQSLKDGLSKAKKDIAEREIQIEQAKLQCESYFNDNKKMKQFLDVVNQEVKKQTDQNVELNKKINSIVLESQSQIQQIQKQLANSIHIVEQQKAEIQQLQMKEKELQKVLQINQQMDQKIKQQNNQIIDLQREHEAQLNMLNNGKMEFQKIINKLQDAETEIKQQRDKITHLSNQNQSLIQKIQQADQEATKIGYLEETLKKSQMTSQQQYQEIVGKLDQQKHHSSMLEQQIKQTEQTLIQFDQDRTNLSQQIKQIQESEKQYKSQILSQQKKIKNLTEKLQTLDSQYSKVVKVESKNRTQLNMEYNGKMEYQRIITKLQDADTEIKQQKDSINQLSNQNQQLFQKLQLAEQESKKKGQLEETLKKSQQTSQQQYEKVLGQLDYWKNYSSAIQQEVQKQEQNLKELEQDRINLSKQIKQFQETDKQQKSEILLQQNELQNVRDKFQETFNKLQDVENYNKQQKEQINQLKNQNQSLKQKSYQPDQESGKKGQLEETLKKSQTISQQYYQETLGKLDYWKNYSSTLQQQIQKNELTLKEYEQNMTTLSFHIKQLQETDKQQKSEILSQQNTLIDINDKLQRLDQQHSNVVKVCREQEGQLNLANNEKIEFQKILYRFQDAEKEIKEQSEQIKDLTIQNQQLRQKSQQADQESVKKEYLEEMLKKSQAAQQQQLQEMTGKIEQWKNYSSKLEQQIQKSQSTSSEFEQDRINLLQQIRQFQEIDKQQKNEMLSLQSTIQELTSKLKIIEQKYSNVVQVQREHEGQLKIANNGKIEVQKLANQLQASYTEIKQQRDQINYLSNQNQSLILKLQEAGSESVKKIQFEELIGKLDQWKIYSSKLEQQIQKTEQILKGLEQDKINLSQQIRLFQDADKQQKNKIFSLQNTIKELNSKLSQLDYQYSKVVKDAQLLQRELNKKDYSYGSYTQMDQSKLLVSKIPLDERTKLLMESEAILKEQTQSTQQQMKTNSLGLQSQQERIKTLEQENLRMRVITEGDTRYRMIESEQQQFQRDQGIQYSSRETQLRVYESPTQVLQ